MALKTTGENQYKGKVCNVDNGRFYGATVTATSTDRENRTIRGCMMRVLCASQNWKKVTDVAPGQLVLESSTDRPATTIKTRTAPGKK